MKNKNLKWMTKVAMLSVVAELLMLIEFPLPFIAPPFYKLDFSEVPVLIGTFALGPMAGVVIEALKILLNFLVNGTVTGGVGEIGNFLVGIAFILPAGLIYKFKKNKSTAVIGMLFGTIFMVVLSSFLNAYILIPAYGKAFKIPIEAFVQMGGAINPYIDNLWKLVLFCVAPFNLIKTLLVSFVVGFIYKPLSPILKGRRATD